MQKRRLHTAIVLCLLCLLLALEGALAMVHAGGLATVHAGGMASVHAGGLPAAHTGGLATAYTEGLKTAQAGELLTTDTIRPTDLTSDRAPDPPEYGPPEYIEILRAPKETVAGEVAGPLSIIIADRRGRLLPGIEVTVMVDSTIFASGTLTLITDEDGFVEFDDLVLTSSGPFRAVVHVKDLEPVIIEPDEPAADATTSVITAEPSTIQADGEEVSLIKVTLFDRHGHRIPSGGDEVVLLSDLGELSPLINHGDGSYTSELSGRTAGTATVTAYLGRREAGDRVGSVVVELVQQKEEESDPGDPGSGSDPNDTNPDPDDPGPGEPDDQDPDDSDDPGPGEPDDPGPGEPGAGEPDPDDPNKPDPDTPDPDEPDPSDSDPSDSEPGKPDPHPDPDTEPDPDLSQELSFELGQNFPNPYRRSTTIRFQLQERSDVLIEVYDLTGRKVETLVQERSLSPGPHQWQWDAGQLTSGVYLYRMVSTGEEGGRFTETRQMTLIR